jgi:WD40 repeat protein
MRVVASLFFMLAFLIGSTAWAQETKGWLGADVLDVAKTEADMLKWDAPHGAKIGVVASGSPADKAGLKAGDIIDVVDGVEIETSSAFEKLLAMKSPSAQLRLRVLSGGSERRVTVSLAERPKIQAVQNQGGPLLMLDTGGHMARITGLAFTPDGKHLVSASEDKVMRVWDWQAGKTIRTIRGQIGPGNEGKIYALALSPDRRWLAAGGWLRAPEEQGYVVRLYDFASGKLAALLTGHNNVVHGLAFSTDGKHLISGSSDRSAIIWDVESRTLVHRLLGHTAAIYGVAFMQDGQRAVTASEDTTLRLWRVGDGGLIANLTGHAGYIRHGLAVRSSDSMIASGDATGEIRLWDGNTGQYLRSFAKQGEPVGALRFSLDGTRLLSTVGRCTFCKRIQHVWEVATGKELVAYTRQKRTVTAATISPDGKLISAGSFDGVIHIWHLATGEKSHELAGAGTPVGATAFSADAQRIAWGPVGNYHTDNDRGTLSFQVRLPSGTQGLGPLQRLNADAVRDFVRARSVFAAYALTTRKSDKYGLNAILDLKQSDKLIASVERGSTDGYEHRAYGFTPDGQIIISGGDGGILAAYDLMGQHFGNFVGHESDVWAVTPSPDGRYLVSGSADQTVRLWNLRTRELIITLFNGTDGEWVLWTPQGYYMGSPGADKIVGWQINKGTDQTPDYVGADQLRRHLNRPDIVEKAIILASAEQAVRESPGTTFGLADLLARPVPKFKILAPLSNAVQHGGRATIRIAIESTPDPIKALRVQVNGRQVDEQTPDIGAGGFSGEHLLDVPLSRGRNEVRITLINDIGEKAETLTLNHEGEGALDKRGTLYVLAIGVDKYATLGKTCGENSRESCDLRFSGADARALVAAVEQRLEPSHTKVVKRVLVNGAAAGDTPTAANILDAIDILKEAKETDTVLLFIAGHGFNDGASYRFLATNAERLGDTFRGTTVVPWQILQEAVEAAKGRRILFLDTCHSGNAYNQTLSNAAYHANIIAYTAARFDQEALEDPKLGHGLFTYAVVEGLQGKGGLGARKQISTKDLAAYVIKRVEELAKQQKQKQEPQYFKGRDAEDYVLASW